MRAALTGGAYTARSVIAGAQECINLYVEPIPQEQNEPARAIHYPTPGLTLLATADQSGCRCAYRATSGALFMVYGTSVYSVSSSWVFTTIGSVSAGTSRVSMADNGVIMFVVDGTTNGWYYTFTTGAYLAINDPGFYGADTVDYYGTYFVFNKPGFPQYYVSDSEAATFTALYFSNFSGYQDPMMAVVQQHGTMALIGQTHTEWWSLSGAADFPFQVIPTASIEHGTGAKYSVTKADTGLFWLSQDAQGHGIALFARGYNAQRVSTHAIETEWQTYSTIDDAVAYSYQSNGHTFVVVNFPTADRTWVFDLSTNLWHRWGAFDGTTLHRHNGQCGTFAYGKNVVGDYATGALYAIDAGNYTDNGVAVTRRRAFPHMVNDGKRMFYTQLIADMECGTTTGDAPVLTLDWSDDRGATFLSSQTSTLGAAGATLTSVQFQRLGMARDRVFRLSWNAPVKTALIGAWIDMRPSGS